MARVRLFSLERIFSNQQRGQTPPRQNKCSLLLYRMHSHIFVA